MKVGDRVELADGSIGTVKALYFGSVNSTTVCKQILVYLDTGWIGTYYPEEVRPVTRVTQRTGCSPEKL